MKRVVFALIALASLSVLGGVSLAAQQPSAVSPMSITPAVNLTICPPPPNALAVCSLFTSTTAASNVSTTETDLITYSLPANTLSANGQKVRITAWFTTAANTNSKTPRLYFGSTVLTSQNTATSAVTIKLVAEVIRTSATAQFAGTFWQSTNVEIGTVTTPAETLSGAVTIKVTGQSATAGNDITAQAMLVEWVP